MALSNELLTPIAGENPAGADLRYDPLHDKIKEARREDLDVPAGDWETTRKTADWALVIKLASDALAKRTKDLQIAVWLAEGLLHRDGFGGFRQGLDLIVSLLDQYWDHLYPELDEDGDSAMRAAPLSWLGLKLDIAVKMAPVTASGASYIAYLDSLSLPTEADAEAEYEGTKRAAREAARAAGKVLPEEFEAAVAASSKEWYKQLVVDIEGCLDALGRLQEKGDELFGEESPGYRPVQLAIDEVARAARQLLGRKLEGDPDPRAPEPPREGLLADTGPGATASPPPSTAPAAAHTASGPSAGSALTSSDDAADRIASAARFLRAQQPTSPAPYLLLRGFRWGELRVGGGSLDPKLLAAPSTDTRVRLKTLLLDRKWPALLEAAEEVMATPFGRGWLDLQRHALSACEAMGGEYEAVAAGIRGSLRSLLADLPGLVDATLMDDSPTANAETLRWLESEGFLGDGGPPDPAPGKRTGDRPPREREPRDKALDLVRAGLPGKGIELLMQEADRARSARTRFLRRTEATGIMVDNGLEAVALPILQELTAQIERFQLEQWESGDLVAEPLSLLYQCLTRTGDDSSARQELYLRVCRLDPISAMSLKEGSSGPDETEQGG